MILVGSFDYYTRQSELERLFSKYRSFHRFDMKLGYGFVYFKDLRDARNAIYTLNNILFGGRILNVKWGNAQSDQPRHKETALKPTKRLFVVNFDPFRTSRRHIETIFNPHGQVVDVQIRRNFAFVKFATQEDATKALNATQGSKILDRPVIIKYAFPGRNEESDHYDGSPENDRNRGLAPASERRRSPSLGYSRYRSPENDRNRGKAPAYERRRSPSLESSRYRSPDRYRDKAPAYERRRSPDSGRRCRTRSPGAGYGSYAGTEGYI